MSTPRRVGRQPPGGSPGSGPVENDPAAELSALATKLSQLTSSQGTLHQNTRDMLIEELYAIPKEKLSKQDQDTYDAIWATLQNQGGGRRGRRTVRKQRRRRSKRRAQYKK